MKRILLLIATFLPIAGAYAQVADKKLPAGFNDPVTRDILIRQTSTANKTAAKTTAKHLRFIASSYIANGQMSDTQHHYYSKDRGSVHPDANSYNDNFFATNPDAKKTIKSDSFKRWYNNGTSLELSQLYTYQYDANNNVTQQTRADYSKMTYDVVYDQQKRKTSVTISDSFGTGIFQPTSKRLYYYDNQNHVILDSGYSLLAPMPTYKQELKYDANGNLTEATSYTYNSMTSKWNKYYVTTYAYDNANRLVERFSQQDYNATGTLVNSSLDSFQYEGNNKNFNYDVSRYWNTSLNAWVGNELHRYHFNSNNFVDTYYIYDWNQVQASWDTVERDVYYYDANGNNLIQYSHGYEYLGNNTFSSTPYDKQSNYYEEYYDLGVADAKPYLSFNIYPNPAINVLNIDIEKPLNGNANITGMDGKILQTIQVQSKDHITIDISSLPKGNYILQLQSNTDNISHVKQFSK